MVEVEIGKKYLLKTWKGQPEEFMEGRTVEIIRHIEKDVYDACMILMGGETTVTVYKEDLKEYVVESSVSVGWMNLGVIGLVIIFAGFFIWMLMMLANQPENPKVLRPDCCIEIGSTRYTIKQCNYTQLSGVILFTDSKGIEHMTSEPWHIKTNCQ